MITRLFQTHNQEHYEECFRALRSLQSSPRAVFLPRLDLSSTPGRRRRLPQLHAPPRFRRLHVVIAVQRELYGVPSPVTIFH